MPKKIKVALIVVGLAIVLYIIYRKIKKRKVDTNITPAASVAAQFAQPAVITGEGFSKHEADGTRAFVEKYGADISEAIKGTGLFFAAVIAQKCLESTYGQSALSAKYNNFGGIKNFNGLKGATGTVELMTSEFKNGVEHRVKQPFAIFATPRDGFNAYVNVIKNLDRKKPSIGIFTADSPEEQIKRIVRAGYCTTNPDSYLKNMHGMMNATRAMYPIGKIV